MKIYPKTNEYLEGLDALEFQVKESKGIEIQYFAKDKEKIVDFGIEKPICELLNRCPYIEEITIHPPLSDYELELLLMKCPKLFLKQVKEIIKLSKKYNIIINMIEHTRITFSQAKLTMIDTLKKATKMMENTNTKLLLENIYMMEEVKNCSVVELCDYLDSDNIKVCIDMCHLYCQAHIYKKEIEEFLVDYLDKDKCKRQVYQVHFAYTKNNDGYIDHKTHGIGHPSEETVLYDLSLLKKYGMDECNYVVEVSEDDYKSRKDQIFDINILNKSYNK